MPRPPRLVHPGAWYHVTARGIERRPIFRDDRDRAHFLELLAELTERFWLRLHAFVLMDNHYHLLLALERPNLSRSIQWLNVSYSVWFNRRRRRSGYLFQGRFKSVLVDPASWGFSLSAYLHLNPVRVGQFSLDKKRRQQARAGVGELPAPSLVEQRLAHLRSYRWSSYPAYIGLEPRPSWLETAAVMKLGGGLAARRRENYRKFVENQVREGLPLQPWEELRDQCLLGDASFIKNVKQTARASAGSGVVRARRWTQRSVAWEEVTAAVEKVRGVSWNQIKDKHGDRGRDLALFLARRATDLTVSELARRTGLKAGENVSMAVKRYQQTIDTNKSERDLAARVADLLFVIL